MGPAEAQKLDCSLTYVHDRVSHRDLNSAAQDRQYCYDDSVVEMKEKVTEVHPLLRIMRSEV